MNFVKSCFDNLSIFMYKNVITDYKQRYKVPIIMKKITDWLFGIWYSQPGM